MLIIMKKVAVGITICTLILTASASVLMGIMYTSENFFGQNDVFVITQKGDPNPIKSYLDMSLSGVIEKLNIADAVSPEIFAFCTLKGEPVIVRGATPEKLLSVDRGNVTEGKIFDNNFSAIIGNKLAKRLSIHVGDRITLTGSFSPTIAEFIVVGIFTTESNTNNEIIISIPSARELADINEGKISIIRIRSNHADEMRDILSPTKEKFMIKNLTYYPQRIVPGDRVTVAVDVYNWGAIDGIARMYLQAEDGTKLAQNDTLVAPDEIVKAKFETVMKESGSIHLFVNLTSFFPMVLDDYIPVLEKPLYINGPLEPEVLSSNPYSIVGIESHYNNETESNETVMVPVQNARVVIDGKQFVTGRSGLVNYTFNKEGFYNITASKIDYQNSSIIVHAVNRSTPFPTLVYPPKDHAIIHSGSVVKFNVTDNDLWYVNYTINENLTGKLLPPPYVIPTAGWSTGMYTITIFAFDRSNQSTTISFNVKIDDISPTVSLLSPANNSAVLPGTFIELSASDNNDITDVFYLEGANRTNLTLPWLLINTTDWAEGNHWIKIIAIDAAGNNGTYLLNITMDTIPPEISMLTQVNDFIVASGTVLGFNITDAGNLSVVSYSLNNGTSLSLPPSFELNTTSWTPGNYSINITAIDTAGNIASGVFFVFVDGDSPSISLISPVENSIIRPGVEVRLCIKEKTGSGILRANCSIDGSNWTELGAPFEDILVNTTNWSVGAKTLRVIAEDFAGHILPRSFKLTVDSNKPDISLILSSPLNNTAFRAGRIIYLKFNETSPFLVSYRINDGNPLRLYPTYKIYTQYWQEGNYLINVTAVDAAGNLAFLSLNYTIDNTNPVIKIISPSSGAIFANGTRILLDIQDANGIRTAHCEILGYLYQYLYPPYDVNTTGWAEGYKQIWLYAEDMAGNYLYKYCTYTVNSTVDTKCPEINLVAPLNNSVIQSGTGIDLDITDDRMLNHVSYSLNGSSEVALDPPYNIDTYSWLPGPCNITVVVNDTYNNTVVRVYCFTIDNTVDTIPPRILIAAFSPANNTLVKVGTKLIFNISDNSVLNSTSYSTDETNWTTLLVVNGTTAISTSGWLEGRCNLTIQANDTQKNSRIAIFYFYIDMTPPNVSLVTPLNNSIISSITNMKFSISELYGIHKKEYSIDGGQKIFLPASITISLKGLFEGDHNIAVTVEDNAGFITNVIYNFTIDDTYPDVQLLYPANNSVFYNSIVISLGITDNSTLNVTYSVNSGVSEPIGPPYSLTLTASQDGPYKIKVTAIDAARNTMTKIFTFICNTTLDDDIPEILLISPKNGAFIHSGEIVHISVTDSNSMVDSFYSLNNGSMQKFPSDGIIATSYWGDNRTYFMKVTATDETGNSNLSAFVFRVDNTPPEVKILSPGDRAMFTAGVDIILSIYDASGVADARFTLDKGPSTTLESPYTIPTSTWKPGVHEVKIYAMDLNHNSVYSRFTFQVLEAPAKALGIENLLLFIVNGTTLSLRVIEVDTGLPVPEANMTIGEEILKTNESGQVSHLFSEVGIFQIIVEKPGYQPCFRSIQVLPNSIIRVIGLSVVPSEITVGTEVDVIAKVENCGENTGSASLVLFANEEPLEGGIRNITLGGRTSDIVIFKYTPTVPGNILLRVSEQTDVLKVKSKLSVDDIVGIIMTFSSDYDVTTARGPLMYEMVDVSKGNIMLVLVSLIIFASFLVTIGISSLLSKSVIERKSVMGILKSIGASRGQIKRILVKETLLVSVPSAFIGVFSGLAVAKFMEDSQMLIIFGQILYPVTDPVFIILMLALITILSLIAAILVGSRMGKGASLVSVMADSEKVAETVVPKPLEELLREDGLEG